MLSVCVCSTSYWACKAHVPYYTVGCSLYSSTILFHIIPYKARLKKIDHKNGIYTLPYCIIFTDNFKTTQAIKYILQIFPYILYYNSKFIKILLNGNLESIYLLRANSLFFILILMADDFCLSQSLELNSRTQRL